ncbi:GatB/YqeY domain-containing protein [Delitschia confertaspora ATCC 74209]|uniref:Altered inheritance of mitochondria protein 41 n=1 Tax=Delitschia confertaspora ATCC 74209 TaxID=1513339 RepID=A0A9P4JPV7_9PLEO|nr:GatB/YqeY domain-containing protein [Delitschia confertaspora ATCC 74209]
MFSLRPTFRSALPRVSLRTISTTPQVLPRLRPDLKTALQTKDKTRLSVLRALLAEITNASKTDKPISSDSALYLLLKKRLAASQAAVEEFQQAKRVDLVGKEEEQMAVLREYLGGIEVMGQEELRGMVEEAVSALGGKGPKVNQGKVMGKVMGAVGDRAVDREQLSKLIGEVLEGSK